MIAVRLYLLCLYNDGCISFCPYISLCVCVARLERASLRYDQYVPNTAGSVRVRYGRSVSCARTAARLTPHGVARGG